MSFCEPFPCRSGYWGYNNGYGKEDNLAAFKETLNGGISFIDTAEVQTNLGARIQKQNSIKQKRKRASKISETPVVGLPSWRQTTGSRSSEGHCSCTARMQACIVCNIGLNVHEVTSSFCNARHTSDAPMLRQASMWYNWESAGWSFAGGHGLSCMAPCAQLRSLFWLGSSQAAS